MRRILILFVLAAVGGVVGAGASGAHTDSDVVAVPAGSDATVTLQPTHGCGSSPTVNVRVRAEVGGATAGEVDGWTATATADGPDRTILEWSGGVLPADETGAFPVHFTAPDTPGELLLFPAIQTCENGEELAWIDGDPTAEYPAPRVLILPADHEAASTIDEVDPDVPGHDLLVAIVDVDNPAATTTTVAEATTTTVATTEAPATTPVGDDGDDDQGWDAAIISTIVVIVVLGAAAAAAVIGRRRADEKAAEARRADGDRSGADDREA